MDPKQPRRLLIREGWPEAAAQVRVRCEGSLLDEPSMTDFDVSDWAWE